jgi:nucleolar protein TMA23
MDAHAHLRGLGWRGTGYSLDTTDRGLAKPLLISHRIDGRGLGSKTQKEKQADRWWLNAFDAALKNFGDTENTALAQVQTSGFNRGGLYGYFVRGGTLIISLDLRYLFLTFRCRDYWKYI